MNAQQLFEAITNIRDEHVTAAEAFRFAKKRRPLRWLSAAAALVLVCGLGAAAVQHGLIPGGRTGSGGSETGSAYMAYAGPIFPLDITEDLPALTAERRVTLDLSPYDDYVYVSSDGSERLRYDDRLAVTDTALLTNTGSEPITVQAVYPFMSDLSGGEELLPVITVNGESTDAALYAGASLFNTDGTAPDSWTTLAPLLADGSYRTAALEGDAPALLQQPVTVYEVANLTAQEGLDAPNPVLDLAFSMDPAKTTVFTWGSTGGTVTAQPGVCSRHFDVFTSGGIGGGSGYLIVLGEDITGLQTQGYTGGIAAPGTETDAVTADILRYESTLGEVLALCLDDLLKNNTAPFGAAVRHMEKTQLLSLAAQALTSGSETAWEGSIEDAFSHMRSGERLLYCCFLLTLAPGETAEVTAAFYKQPSYDHFGSGANRSGYDLVTLTQHLHYTRQTAFLQNVASVEILAQDFGFAPEDGGTSVLLTGEHYTLEVRKKE